MECGEKAWTSGQGEGSQLIHPTWFVDKPLGEVHKVVSRTEPNVEFCTKFCEPLLLFFYFLFILLLFFF